MMPKIENFRNMLIHKLFVENPLAVIDLKKAFFCSGIEMNYGFPVELIQVRYWAKN